MGNQAQGMAQQMIQKIQEQQVMQQNQQGAPSSSNQGKEPEQQQQQQQTPWQIYAAEYVLGQALTHDVYTKRVHRKAMERGQREAMVAYCYEIYDAISELLSQCPDSREKGILMATIIQIKQKANYGMRKGPAPDAARNEICDNLRRLVINTGQQLNFPVSQPQVIWNQNSVAGVDKSGYGSKVTDRLKYYAKGKGKGGGYLYKFIGQAITNYAPQ